MFVAFLALPAALRAQWSSPAAEEDPKSALQSTLLLLPSQGSGGPVDVKEPQLTGWPYTCVWNSPVKNCIDQGLDFELLRYFIVQNDGLTFLGNHISILMIDEETDKRINGGIPQLGKLSITPPRAAAEGCRLADPKRRL